jgi:hypothetical protein
MGNGLKVNLNNVTNILKLIENCNRYEYQYFTLYIYYYKLTVFTPFSTPLRSTR